MDSTQISQLTPSSQLSGVEYIPISQYFESTGAYHTVYTTPSALSDYVLEGMEDAFCPVGTIAAYAGTLSSVAAPVGWLLCDGRAVQQSQYSRLFSRIGTTYGASSPSTFNLPNVKGRVMIGHCSTAVTQDFSYIAGANWPAGKTVGLGAIGGQFAHRLTIDEIPLEKSNIKIPSSLTQVVQSIIPTPEQPTKESAKEINTPNQNIQIYYHRGNATREDTLDLGVYGRDVPNVLDLEIFFSQAQVKITDAGAWVDLGASGNNSTKIVKKSIRPDNNGEVKINVIFRGEGNVAASVTASVPSAVVVAPDVVESQPANNTLNSSTLESQEVYTYKGVLSIPKTKISLNSQIDGGLKSLFPNETLPNLVRLTVYGDAAKILISNGSAWMTLDAPKGAPKTWAVDVAPVGGDILVTHSKNVPGDVSRTCMIFVNYPRTNVAAQSSNAPSSFTTKQTIYWEVELYYQSVYTWQGDTLKIEQIRHPSKRDYDAKETTIRYKTVRSDGYVVNQGTYKTKKNYGTFELPFKILQTDDVVITPTPNPRGTIETKQSPGVDNNFTTITQFNDPIDDGGKVYACTLELTETVNTPATPATRTTDTRLQVINNTDFDASVVTPWDGNAAVSFMQPYMTMNYIIKY